jgi:putative aldouronate transport system substrate-binding protein
MIEPYYDTYLRGRPEIEEKKWQDIKKNRYYELSTDRGFPSIPFTADEQKVIDELRVDINNYANQNHAKWFVNGGIDADWAAYTDRLSKMGLDRFLAAYQSAYDRFVKSMK